MNFVVGVVPTGFFRHPIASKNRMRYERELATNEMSSKLSHIKDSFSEYPLYVGVSLKKKYLVRKHHSLFLPSRISYSSVQLSRSVYYHVHLMIS